MHHSISHTVKNTWGTVALLGSSLLIALSLTACSNRPTKTEKEPKPPTIRVEATELTGGVPGSVIEKNLLTIIITPEKVLINNKAIKGLKRIEEEIKKYQKPAITIRAHKCSDKDLTTQLMSLAQDHTDTPIPFGSYGSFDDKACED